MGQAGGLLRGAAGVWLSCDRLAHQGGLILVLQPGHVEIIPCFISCVQIDGQGNFSGFLPYCGCGWHRCKNHHRDSNKNPMEVMSDEMIAETVQINHEENLLDPADDDCENVHDTNSAVDNENGSCLKVQSDEEWVRDYAKMSKDSIWSRDITDTADKAGGQMNTMKP